MKLLPHKIPQGVLPGHRYQPKSNLCLIFGGVFSFFPLNWPYFNHFWLLQSLSACIVCGQVLFIVLTDLSPYTSLLAWNFSIPHLTMNESPLEVRILLSELTLDRPSAPLLPLSHMWYTWKES